MDAAELLAVVRAELAPVERGLADHHYLAELEAGRVPLDSLPGVRGRAAGDHHERPEKLRAPRTALPAAAGRRLHPGSGCGRSGGLRLLERLGAAVGLGADYEPLAGCQAYSAYVAWLALNASPADVALAFLANLESWRRGDAEIAKVGPAEAVSV